MAMVLLSDDIACLDLNSCYLNSMGSDGRIVLYPGRNIKGVKTYLFWYCPCDIFHTFSETRFQIQNCYSYNNMVCTFLNEKLDTHFTANLTIVRYLHTISD